MTAPGLVLIYRTRILWLISLLAVLLSACAPIVQLAQPLHTDFIRLPGGETIGQTFHSRFDGLQAVVLHIDKQNSASGRLVMSLFGEARLDGPLLAQTTQALEDLAAPGNLRFRIPAQDRSARQDYYLQIKYEGQGSLRLARGPEDAYLDGALYQNDTPRPLQLTFRLIYDPQLAVMGLLTEVVNWIVWLLAGVWLFIVPGWSILNAALPVWHPLPKGVKTGLAIGFSLALYPLILLFSGLIGLQLNNLTAWLIPGVCCLVGAWAYLRRRGSSSEQASSPVSRHSQEPLADLALIVLLSVIFFTRFWPARDLAAPLFGDSYQHAVITQLLAEHGGLFTSWLPYSELTTFTYHFGFHAAALAFHWITNLSIPQSVLWYGQILNVLAVLSLYPLGVRMSGSRWGGVVAVLVAGLLSPMPMDYMNWGRYPQLAGQAILPVIGWLLWELLETRKKSWQIAILAGTALGGLALTHYRVLVLALVWIGVSTIFNLGRDSWRSSIARVSLASVVGGILFLPWFVGSYAGKMMEILSHQMSMPVASTQKVVQPANTIGDLFVFLPAWLWLVLPILIAWGLWRRDKKLAIICSWWFLNTLIANPQWLKLPGAGAISSFTVFIAAYIPASLIGGAAVVWLFSGFNASPRPTNARNRKSLVDTRRVLTGLGLLLLLGISVSGARTRLEDISPGKFALVTYPYLRAAAWIRTHVPQDAHFLVNAFSAFDGYTVVGSDAGWWLPMLAQRSTSLPPINYGFEQGTHPDYRKQVNSLVEQLEYNGANSAHIRELLIGGGFTHIYIGQLQGSVNNSGEPILDPEVLRASPFYRPIYHQDRVWIFEILPVE